MLSKSETGSDSVGLVPVVGLEPTRGISPTDFESVTSANSITPARIGYYTILPWRRQYPGRGFCGAVFSACAAHPSCRRFSITKFVIRTPRRSTRCSRITRYPLASKNGRAVMEAWVVIKGASTARSSRSQSAVAMPCPWRSLCTYSRSR